MKLWTAEQIARQIAEMDRGRVVLADNPLPKVRK